MPRKGFRSITVREEIYDELMRQYKDNREELLKQGVFFSRPYGIWSDMAYSRDPQTTTVLKKVKGIFDPNNVMNPGKLCFKK